MVETTRTILNSNLYTVYNVMLEHVKNTSCTPQAEQIADAAGMNKRTVQKYVRILRDMKVIVSLPSNNLSYRIYTLANGRASNPHWVALNGTTLTVYRTLVEYINTHNYAPSAAQIAKLLHLDKSTVLYHMRTLRAMKLVHISLRDNYGYLEVRALVSA